MHPAPAAPTSAPREVGVARPSGCPWAGRAPLCAAPIPKHSIDAVSLHHRHGSIRMVTCVLRDMCRPFQLQASTRERSASMRGRQPSRTVAALRAALLLSSFQHLAHVHITESLASVAVGSSLIISQSSSTLLTRGRVCLARLPAAYIQVIIYMKQRHRTPGIRLCDALPAAKDGSRLGQLQQCGGTHVPAAAPARYGTPQQPRQLLTGATCTASAAA